MPVESEQSVSSVYAIRLGEAADIETCGLDGLNSLLV